ncbi:hypothetical protein T4D_8027 [Trichinella pseudospiralis]|uniref:Uncharacterized protein n=1 Tax=Trichinella pseudospiralis TaxID=6337 RepID=A0A0V1F698_TRIPS|nr:hypothetical protein T4D_8027 [Trichinella pseudospiralis]
MAAYGNFLGAFFVFHKGSVATEDIRATLKINFTANLPIPIAPVCASVKCPSVAPVFCPTSATSRGRIRPPTTVLRVERLCLSRTSCCRRSGVAFPGTL